MRFSERHGYKPPKLMQVDSVDRETRNQLWDITWDVFLTGSSPSSVKWKLADRYYLKFLKRSSDDFYHIESSFRSELKHMFFSSEFFGLFDFLEFVVDCDASVAERYQAVFSAERVAYRFIGQAIVPISDERELAEFEAVMSTADRFAGARSHMTTALNAFSKRPAADYRNAIREAISAVESAAKVIAGNDKADLGAALRIIDKAHGMHPAFREAVTKLYAYTSDEKGIRHALLEEDAKVDEADAHFMLVACAAFVNFLVQRYGG